MPEIIETIAYRLDELSDAAKDAAPQSVALDSFVAELATRVAERRE